MVIANFANVYPTVAANTDKILEEIRKEEEKFGKTLADGTRELEKIIR